VQQDNTDKERTQRKSYVWLHPPRKIELQPYDELFVLTENYQDEESSTSKKETAGTETAEPSGGNMKNEGKKIQNESMKSLSRLNSVLVDLQYNSSELQRNTMESGSLLM
jgi:hypothetical protein